MIDREDDASPEVFLAGGVEARRNYQLIIDHMAAECLGDLEGTMATMSRNEPFQINHATGMDIRGWDQVREFYRQRMTTYSGQSFFPQRWVVSDKVAVGMGFFKSAPQGTFFGLQARGKELLVPMTIWFYFEDGLVKGEAGYLDGHELRRQICEGATEVIRPIY